MAYYEDVVRPLQWCVMDVQRAGMLVDMDYVRESHAHIERKLEEERNGWKHLLERKFNPSSSQQVIELFERDFHIPLRNKKNEYSADVLTLLFTTLEHPTLPIV